MARQPITTASLDLYGYELLFRAGPRNQFTEGKDALEATSEVLCHAISGACDHRLTRGTKAFVNLPRELLLDDRLQVVSPEILVLEILETVVPDEAVVIACKKWKEKGYLLALDDFTPAAYNSPLIPLVDIIKVDFRATSAQDQWAMVPRFRRKGLQFLAEKVETQDEFERARKAGYSLFQGYYFARPVVLADKQIPGNRMHYLRVLEETNKPEVNVNRIDKLISEDVSLTYKLLAFVNSAAFPVQGTVRTIRQALVLLGESGTRRWVALTVLVAMAVERPGELLINALARAKFAESASALMGLPRRSGEFFLLGMLSRLEAIMGVPLSRVLRNLALAPDIHAALLGKGKPTDPPAVILDMTALYEAGKWEGVRERARGARLEQTQLDEAYLNSLLWADHIFSAKG